MKRTSKPIIIKSEEGLKPNPDGYCAHTALFEQQFEKLDAKKQAFESKIQKRQNELVKRGVKKGRIEKHIKDYRKELKTRWDDEERAYWRAKQEKRFGRLNETGQEEGKDYLKCLKKR